MITVKTEGLNYKQCNEIVTALIPTKEYPVKSLRDIHNELFGTVRRLEATMFFRSAFSVYKVRGEQVTSVWIAGENAEIKDCDKEYYQWTLNNAEVITAKEFYQEESK